MFSRPTGAVASPIFVQLRVILSRQLRLHGWGVISAVRVAELPGDRKDWIVKTIAKILATAGLAAGLVVGGGAVAANASYSNVQVGGGWWAYGTGLNTYSDFTQNQRTHTSTVKVDGQYGYSANARPGATSKATRKTGRTNYAYWNNV